MPWKELYAHSWEMWISRQAMQCRLLRASTKEVQSNNTMKLSLHSVRFFIFCLLRGAKCAELHRSCLHVE
jgi:hypothetical protein